MCLEARQYVHGRHQSVTGTRWGGAQAYAEENGLFFWETSAKSNVNVAEVFQDIAERLPRAAAPPQQVRAPAGPPAPCRQA